MKNKKQDGKVPLRLVASMRVISEPVVAALKAATEVLNDRPEFVPLFENLVKLVAREGNLDFLSQGEDNLPLRVAVLEQHVKDLQKEEEQRRKSSTPQQKKKQADRNTIISERFSTLWTGKSQGRRLLPEGVALMQSLFATNLTDPEIHELSGMELAAIKRHRTKWEKKTAPEAQSGLPNCHNHTQLAVTAPGSGVTTRDLTMVKERSKRASGSGYKVKIPILEAKQSQADKDTMLNTRTDPAPSPHREVTQKSSQNFNRRHSKGVDSREPRCGLNSLQQTEMANMLIERKFRAKQSGLTLKLIGEQFGISGDAVKKNYLPVLQKAGLLDKDRLITHEEILEVYAPKNRLP